MALNSYGLAWFCALDNDCDGLVSRDKVLENYGVNRLWPTRCYTAMALYSRGLLINKHAYIVMASAVMALCSYGARQWLRRPLAM